MSRSFPLFYKSVFALLLTATLLVSATSAAAAERKAVFHVDFADPTRYSLTLTSINNLINDAENDLRDWDVHLVFVGLGMRFIAEGDVSGTPYAEDEELAEMRSNLNGRLRNLMDNRDVQVSLCEITRAEVDIADDEFFEGVEFVRSGVGYIADLQADGFAYLKVW